MFLPEEVEYLKSTSAVKNATANRITYTDSFKRMCLRRYRAGESAAIIFESVGLPSSLIGAKRIERSIARWKSDPSLTEDKDPVAQAESNLQIAQSDKEAPDDRDLLISRQALRIMVLERELAALRMSARQHAMPAAALDGEAALV
ncbi:transposase [Bifidobacterium avesanii]|uniref:Transposase n=1 Tax=Bifidobacterium avesanii TaxID=1798157 RepID=A0A7K3TJ71_9BIFI|nr:transposase [Bifidobacterium avesanii]